MTESLMLLCLFSQKTPDVDSDLVRSKLVHLWSTIGFYDRGHEHIDRSRESVQWQSHITESVRQYWELYLSSCNDASKIVYLYRSIVEANQLFDDGRATIEDLFSGIESPPEKVESTFKYRWVNEITEGKDVTIISPFARLMKKQVDDRNMEVLRPLFRPAKLNYFQFPYCFENQGPHQSSFETIDWVVSEAQQLIEPGSSVLLSCGSMGVPIASRLHEMGANVFYCGASLQLFFGIMGARWRRNTNDRALDKEDRLLESIDTNPECWVFDIPQEIVPSNAAVVENACYW